MSGVIRGVTLVNIDSVRELKGTITLPEQIGLPMIAPDCCPDNRIDERRNVEVSLTEDSILIDWSENNPPLYKVSYERLSFTIGEGDYVQGVVVSELTPQESQAFNRHLQAIKH
jgi:hypothetical protein